MPKGGQYTSDELHKLLFNIGPFKIQKTVSIVHALRP